MHRFYIILFSLYLCLGLHAQTEVSGTVVDNATSKPIDFVTVTFLRNGSPLKFARTDEMGNFSINTEHAQRTDSLSITCLGYARKKIGITPNQKITIRLQPESFELKEVQVRGNRVIGRADTTVYDLTRFASARDNSLKDVLRKLPGVDIDDDGTVKVNGKAVNRFTVEGLDMTGGRYNQLEENIKAKDVKKAEVIDHDQPIKALQDKVFTDNIAMNIVMKDSVRDKWLLILKPYLLVGETKTVGGSANAMQIGKRKQTGYDAAYDRTGKDLSEQTRTLTSWRPNLSAGDMPSWINEPHLVAPIDADRLRFNTSQRYAVNQIQKKGDNELRLSAHYLRTVERQDTKNESLYSFGDSTTQQQHLHLTNDDFSIEAEQTINSNDVYGNNLVKLDAHKTDGRSAISDSLNQRIKIPEVNVVGSLYRLYTLGKGQLTVNATADYHYSQNSLNVNPLAGGGLVLVHKNINTNLYHTAANISYLRARAFFTHRLTALFDAQNLNADGNTSQIAAQLTPYWQYKLNPWLVSLSVRGRWERYPRQNETFFLLGGSAYTRWNSGRRSELRMSLNYNENTADAESYVIKNLQKDYRNFFTTDGFIPKYRSLSSSVDYVYKRPIAELFFNASFNAGHTWSDAADGLSIIGGCYHLSLVRRPTQSSFVSAEGYASKGFFDLNLKVRVGASFSYNEGEQLSGDAMVDYRTTACRLLPNVEFSPSWGAASYRGEFAWLHSAGMSTLFDWRQSLSMTSTIGPVDLTFTMTHYHNELQSSNAMNAMIGDVRAVWRMRKLRLSVALSNVFNKREYAVSQYSSTASLTDRYVLRGRELLFTVQL